MKTSNDPLKPVLTLAAAALLSLAANAQNIGSEIAVQGRSDDGGSATAIVGTARQIRFSLTARRGDVAGVVLAGGRSPFFSASLQQIIEGRSGPLVLDGPVATIPDGRTRIFVRINNPNVAQFRGSKVRVFSGNYLFDEDPVIFR